MNYIKFNLKSYKKLALAKKLSYTTEIWFCERGGMVDALDLKSYALFSIIYKYQSLKQVFSTVCGNFGGKFYFRVIT